MSRRAAAFVLLLAGCATIPVEPPPCACFTPEPPFVSNVGPQQLDRFLAEAVGKKQIAGGAIRMSRGEDVVYSNSAGFADLAAGRRIDGRTLFRMQSMTKPVMAATILALVDAGKLKLDDDIATYLPDFAKVRVYKSGKGKAMVTEPLARPITVHDLLTHTSGMSFGFDPDDAVDALYREREVFADGDTTATRVAKVASVPLRRQPGGPWHYGASYEVLGRLAEVVEGKSLPEIMEERIFAPLDMKHSGFRFGAEALAHAGPVYRANGDELVVVDDPALDIALNGEAATMTSGGNGLMMSADDAIRFAMMLANNGRFRGRAILSRASADMMTSNRLVPAQYPDIAGAEGLGFGFGGSVVIGNAPGEVRNIGEYRWGGVAGTKMIVDPVRHVAAVVMTQTMSSPALKQPWDMSYAIAAADLR